jgi:hypothetical protein
LASGYTYGYSSTAVKVAGIYGNQARGWYSGAEMVTVALTTPPPSPEPSPAESRNVAAVEAIPLKPPPPPAPFFESGTAAEVPLQVMLLNGYAGSQGSRDGVYALAGTGHVYRNASITDDAYQATTIDVFGRVIRDFSSPAGAMPKATSSQFAGETATFTTSSAPASSPQRAYFQFKETVGVQSDDPLFAPSVGSITWLTALSGPVAHAVASYATGEGARYYAVDLMGFRLTDVRGDIATQEGWQVSVPLLNVPGWILTGGSLTQTASDRIAIQEQGLVSGYAAAIADVPSTTTRPQHLDNASLLSPWLTVRWLGDIQLQFVGGYDFGTVTGCGTAPNSTTKVPVYACETQLANHGVGGMFFKLGSSLNFGATDTSALPGSISAAGAARNLGTSGALPGSVTVYAAYTGCPRISAAYTNAAFPTGVPLPQQGSTLSGQVDYPIVIGALQLDLAAGMFNERPLPNSGPSSSGAFGSFYLSTARSKTRC